MNADFDELVRDSMTRFTDGVDIPAGLAQRARDHLRSRHRVQLGWLTAGATVAATAAVLAGTIGIASAPQHLATAKSRTARNPGQHVTIQTTAVVIDRVDRALAKAAAADPVAYTRESIRGVRLYTVIPHGQPAEVNVNVAESWSRGPIDHVEYVTSTGAPALSMRTDLASGKSVQITVSYPQRVWWSGTYQAPILTKPELGCTLDEIDLTAAQWTSEVKKLLSCHAALAGYERVDGVETIKLKLSSSYQRACAAASDRHLCQLQSVGWTGVLWANESTYLPVRLASRGQRYSSQIDFRWLTPDAANLAKLDLPVPAGFRHV